jgi:hypothetical protein
MISGGSWKKLQKMNGVDVFSCVVVVGTGNKMAVG